MAYGETRASDVESRRNAQFSAGSGIAPTGPESTVTPLQRHRQFGILPVVARAWKRVSAPRVWASADTTVPCSRSPQSIERRRQGKAGRALAAGAGEKTMRRVVYSEYKLTQAWLALRYVAT